MLFYNRTRETEQEQSLYNLRIDAEVHNSPLKTQQLISHSFMRISSGMLTWNIHQLRPLVQFALLYLRPM